jgi:hypothetical protein
LVVPADPLKHRERRGARKSLLELLGYLRCIVTIGSKWALLKVSGPVANSVLQERMFGKKPGRQREVGVVKRGHAILGQDILRVCQRTQQEVDLARLVRELDLALVNEWL